MKINLSPGKFKILRGTILLIAVALFVYVGYAATTLSISNTGSVTVATGTNLLASLQGTTNPGTGCSTITTPAYTDSGLAITTWSVPQGASQTQYACIKNSGTYSDTLAITQTGTLPSGVTFTSTGAGTIVPSGGFAPVSFTLTATTSATLGSLSFTISIN